MILGQTVNTTISLMTTDNKKTWFEKSGPRFFYTFFFTRFFYCALFLCNIFSLLNIMHSENKSTDA